MAYSTAAQIKRWAALLSTVADGDIEAHQPDIESTIDAKLSKFFVVPISPVDVILQNAAAQIVAGVALASRLGQNAPNKSDLARDLKKDGWALIADILADPSLLPQATRKTVTSADEKKDRVSYTLPRSGPIFSYKPWTDMPNPSEEPDTTRGQ